MTAHLYLNTNLGVKQHNNRTVAESAIPVGRHTIQGARTERPRVRVGDPCLRCGRGAPSGAGAAWGDAGAARGPGRGGLHGGDGGGGRLGCGVAAPGGHEGGGAWGFVLVACCLLLSACVHSVGGHALSSWLW